MSITADYAARKASEKRALLWSEIAADLHADGALPSRAPGGLSRLRLLSVDFNRGSFELPGDALPPERRKLVHTWGACARLRFEITHKTRYTGFFETGGEAIARFSDAKGGGDFLPSIALKFFVDGQASRNLLTLPAAARAKGDARCFSSAFSNAAPGATTFDGKLVQGAFERTSRALGGSRLHAVYLPLHHLASIAENGEAPAVAVVPDRVELRPTQDAIRACPEGVDFRAALAAVPAGTKLFDVLAAAAIDEPTEILGAIWQDSAWLASRYGDERLFFAHDVGPVGPHG